jgi:hypothetical protein
MADDLPQTWLLFVAERAGRPIASSLIALHDPSTTGSGQNDSINAHRVVDAQVIRPVEAETVAYGRYWGALERVDCLHFEACYYQPLQWCIEHRHSSLRGRRAGRAQDGTRPAPGAGPRARTGWRTRTSPRRWSAFWRAKARAWANTWTICRRAAPCARTAAPEPHRAGVNRLPTAPPRGHRSPGSSSGPAIRCRTGSPAPARHGRQAPGSGSRRRARSGPLILGRMPA